MANNGHDMNANKQCLTAKRSNKIQRQKSATKKRSKGFETIVEHKISLISVRSSFCALLRTLDSGQEYIQDMYTKSFIMQAQGAHIYTVFQPASYGCHDKEPPRPPDRSNPRMAATSFHRGSLSTFILYGILHMHRLLRNWWCCIYNTSIFT